MNKATKIFYFVVLTLGICYMVMAVMYGSNEVFALMGQASTVTVEPTETHILSDSESEFVLELEEPDKKSNMALEFYTTHAYVFVYAEDELLYSVSGNDSVYGRSTGSRIHMVELPEGTTSVRVIVRSVFGSLKNAPEFFYGDAITIYRDIMNESLLDAALSLFIMVVGLFLIIYWFIVHKKVGRNPAVVYFGLFSVMIGMWTMNETDVSRLIYTNRMVGSLIAYMLLSLMVTPFVQFVRYFFEKEKSVLCNVICVCASIETVVLAALHITGVAEFKQTAWTIHGMMFIALAFMAFSVRERIHRYGFDHKVKMHSIAICALLFSVVTDLAAYYIEIQQTDALGKLGFLVYILILGRESAADTFKKIRQGEKAQSYLKLAMTDVMTGLLNRSAFEEWEDKTTDFRDTMIVTFDLNNLKYCNDNLGHAAGDEYIIASADIIQRVFGAVGQCYRIGGDEFCAVIRKSSSLKIKKYLERLREEQAIYNELERLVKIHIAVGYAVFADSDADIEETRSRADVCMYRNKQQLKESGER